MDDALAIAMEGRSGEEFFPPLAFTDTLLRFFRREFPAAVECGKKCLDLALLLDALGKRDEAFAELDRASEEYSYMVLFLNVDPKTDALRNDPRFARLGSRLLGFA